MTKKRALGILKTYRNSHKRPLADFNHSPQAKVSRILKNILFPLIAKKCSMNSQNKSIFTRKEYKKQIIDKNQVKRINLTQVLFCTPSKKGITIIPLLLNNQCTKRNTMVTLSELLKPLRSSAQIN